MSSAISSDKLRQEISVILRSADLNTLSSKKVRQLLETLFQCDLTDRKKEIDDMVMAEITTRDIQPIPNNGQEDQNDQQADSTAKGDQDKGMEIQQQENRPTAQILNVMRFGNIFQEKKNDFSLLLKSSTSTTVYRKPTAPPTKLERRRTCYNKELDISDQLATVVGGYRVKILLILNGF